MLPHAPLELDPTIAQKARAPLRSRTRLPHALAFNVQAVQTLPAHGVFSSFAINA